jgi:hypothetical protein
VGDHWVQKDLQTHFKFEPIEEEEGNAVGELLTIRCPFRLLRT